jgi:hypothetical protein
MKRLAVLALILLALPILGRAQEDNGLYYYDGKVKEIASFVLEFAQTFVHPPVLLRGGSKGETKLFVTASLKLENEDAVIRLCNKPYQEDLDSLERLPTVNFVQLQTAAGEPVVLVTLDEEGGNEWNLNPASATRALKEALLKALDAKFKRRASI